MSGSSSECLTASSIHFPTSIFRCSVGGGGEDRSEIRSHSDSDHHVVFELQSVKIPGLGAIGEKCLSLPSSASRGSCCPDSDIP